MAFNKVFFHGAGPGIGDLIKEVHEADIPFVMKSIANEGWIEEALRYVVADGPEHTLIYRDPGPGGAGDDHPDLSLPPDQSAGEFWARVEPALPFTVKDRRDEVWVEPTNEIDTNAHAEWLGEFQYELAKLMLDDGYKVLLSGHNAGQPDVDHWELYFEDFLRLCAEYPDRCGVSLHEAKLGDMYIPAWSDTWVPYLIGRYIFLHQACDRMKIPRPLVVISEWAWSYRDIPGDGAVEADIRWLSEEIAKHPNILGICLWNLDPGWGDATKNLPKHIDFVKQLTLETVYPDPEPPDNELILDWVDDLPTHPNLSYTTRLKDEVEGVVIHHTVTESGIEWVERIADYHVNTRQWPGIGYHYCIDAEGTIVQTNRLETVSYHSGNYNRKGIGVALLGNFTEEHPTNAQLEAARWLSEEIQRQYDQTLSVVPHGDVPDTQTSCPGATHNEWFDKIIEDAPSLEEYLWEQSVETQSITLNPSAALQKAIFQDGFVPVGTEVWATYEGDEYAYMPAETLDEGQARRVYYAKVPNWDEVASFENPFEDGPVEPPDPQPESYDMANYYLPPVGDFGPIVTLANNWGAGNERQQLQRDGNDSYVTKNQQWERRRIAADYIYLNMDTSPGGGQFYISDGPWIPRVWGPEHPDFSTSGTITFKNKGDCKVTAEYPSTGTFLRCAEHHDSYQLGDFHFSDVMVIQWIVDGRVEETSWLAAGYGLIRWLRSNGDESKAVEIIPVGHQENNTRESIPCAGI